MFLRRTLSEAAAELSVKAHLAEVSYQGQIDKADGLYILHSLRAMFSRSEDERICAVINDVIEDTDITLEYLEKFKSTYQP